MMMFFGITSSRRSSDRRWRRQRFRSAMATARLALFWPMMYLSSSSTIWRGVRVSFIRIGSRIRGHEDLEKRDARVSWTLAPYPLTEPLKFLDRDLLVRVDTDVAGDLHGRLDHLPGIQ